MNKGDTYCTMWTDHICGVFTYDGLSNVNGNNVIQGPEDSLSLVQQGFNIMHELHVGDEFEYDYVKRVQEFMRPECIDNAIDGCNNTELNELKKYSSQISKIIGG